MKLKLKVPRSLKRRLKAVAKQHDFGSADAVIDHFLTRGLAHYGEEVVIVAGVPPGVVRSTNVMKLHRIGEEVKLS